MTKFGEKAKPFCPNKHINECKNPNPDNCKYKKSSCLYVREEKEHKKFDKTPLKIWVFILVALITYLILIIWYFNLTFEVKTEHGIYTIVFSFISGLCISVIAGAVLTWVIDIPSKLKQYENY